MTTVSAKIDYSYKRIWAIAFPILVSLVVEQLIGLTDTAFMGRVGEVELGASAIAGVFYLVIFMAGHGFCIGSPDATANRTTRPSEIFSTRACSSCSRLPAYCSRRSNCLPTTFCR